MSKPDKRCGTCKWYEPSDADEGFCGNQALTLGKEKLRVREGVMSCAGQYHGGRVYWEPKGRRWWPFGRG